MKNLILIGAGGFGREIYDFCTQTEEYNKEFVVKGFLDSNPEAMSGFENYPPILNSVEEYEIEEDDVFVCSIGSVKLKKKNINLIQNKGGEFISIIHPTAIINSNVKLGKGVLILSYTNIKSDSQIGDYVTIQPHCVLGHDVKIGEFCHLNSFSFMGGNSILEDEVLLNTKSTILPNVKIGMGSTVGVSSVVIKNVKSGITVFGYPAKELKF